MRLKGIRVKTLNLESMLCFYRDILSMKIIDKTDKSVFFESGLELVNGVFLDAFEFEFETISISPILCNLNGFDYVLGHEDGVRILSLTDPDGNIIHISETGDKGLKVPGEMDLEYQNMTAFCGRSGYMFENKDNKS